MKLLLFTDCLGAGGAQRQLVGLAIMLHEKGYDVKVCTYYKLNFYKKNLDDANVPNEIIPGAENYKTRILAVRRYFKQENPDWIIAYQETPSLVASIAKLLGCNFKLLVSERNTTQAVGMNERVRFFLYRWANAIVPNSYSQEKYLSEHFPWMRKKLNTITNFVDLEQFSFVQRTRREVPEIIVAASIWAPKNTVGLIESVKVLSKLKLKFHISWYGKTESDMDYYNKCQELINKYGISEYIQLLDKTSKINEAYQNADYLCLPSFYEGTPNVICEAISTGLPIICSDVCDNSIYVRDRENGFLFDPSKKESIVMALKSALSLDDNSYSSYSLVSRQIAKARLDKNKFIERYIDILKG